MIHTTTGFDAVTAENLPPNAEVVFAYVCGAYANVAAVRARCPKARLITICVDALHAADMLDVERYDATPGMAPPWVLRRRNEGRRPVIYTSRANIGAVEAAFGAAGVAPPFYGAADWTNAPHLVSGSVGTQWADGSPKYPGLAVGTDTWLISPNWPDRFQRKGGPPKVKLPTRRQLLTDLMRLAAAIGAVSAVAPQLHLPPWARAVLGAAALVVTRAEQVLKSATPTPPTPAPPA